MARGRILFLLLAGAINCAPAWLWAGGPLSDGATNFQVTALTQGGVRVSSCPTAKLDNAAGEVQIATSAGTNFIFYRGLMHLISRPGTITDLFASTGTVPGSFDITWTARGLDGSTGTITDGYYRIDYSTEPAHPFIVSTYKVEFGTNVSPGDDQFKTITGLMAGATYYIRIYLGDNRKVFSQMSNAANCHARIVPPGISTPAFTNIFTSSFTVNWTSGTPASGYNPEGTHYDVKICTVPDFQSGTVSSSQTTNLSAAFENLYPNTTYYARAAAYYRSSTTTYTTLGSTSTLANQAENTQVYKVYTTSVTVNWKPLPTEEQGGSSSTCEGYILQASTESGFVPLWDSSTTAGVSLSTLTINNLTGDNTYYFRVGSLNRNNVPNYAASTFTYLARILGVEFSTDTITIGDQSLRTEVLIDTNVVIVNTGNVTETYKLRAATITAGSPWTISNSSGTNTFVLLGVINDNQPSSDDFHNDDKLDDVDIQCTDSVFTLGTKTGVSVPPGEERTLWLKLGMPRNSTTTEAQKIKLTGTAIEGGP